MIKQGVKTPCSKDVVLITILFEEDTLFFKKIFWGFAPNPKTPQTS
jgi:hypothetical protein